MPDDPSARRHRRTARRLGPAVGAAWPAPTADVPLDARVRVPGSKSMTMRAVLLAAGSHGPSALLRPAESRDAIVLARALRSMGCHVSGADEGRWLLRPRPLGGAEIDVEGSGSALRLLPPLAGTADGTVLLRGHPPAVGRSVAALVDALAQVGVPAGGQDGALLRVDGTGRVDGGHVRLDASQSSQLVSGLLLAGAHFARGVRVEHAGPPMAAHPHVRLTVAMLRAAGATVDDGTPDRWEVAPGRLVGRAWTIEPDLVAAAPFLAAAVAGGGRVWLADWPARPTRPARQLRWLLGEFGASCVPGTAGLCVTATDRPRGLHADVSGLDELLPVVVALCALATGPSRLTGVADADRMAALSAAIGTLGGRVALDADVLTVRPRPLCGGPFDTRGDHRLAYAGAVLGLAVPGVVLSDVACTAKTLPDFPARWTTMLGDGRMQEDGRTRGDGL